MSAFWGEHLVPITTRPGFFDSTKPRVHCFRHSGKPLFAPVGDFARCCRLASTSFESLPLPSCHVNNNISPSASLTGRHRSHADKSIEAQSLASMGPQGVRSISRPAILATKSVDFLPDGVVLSIRVLPECFSKPTWLFRVPAPAACQILPIRPGKCIGKYPHSGWAIGRNLVDKLGHSQILVPRLALFKSFAQLRNYQKKMSP
ncbi:hypothetical protein QBC38DRAFT_276002 [Podospora fimiseda]|uniref:Uncharacterized protein n=1 Tax=Podospora fimiseda TaxID=252190 RepID=A0AAN7BWK2_9PEZI|nr:hypothetical protein QBC38DRAFT_276002 [Podospora fimiseda]